MTYLSDLLPGQTALVCNIEKSDIRRRLYELGLVEDTCVSCIARSVLGGPSAYLIRGTAVALRREDAHTVCIRCVENEKWD